MIAKLRSWWQKVKQHRRAMGVVALVLIVVVVIVLIIAVVLSNGTGFNGYTVKSTATETTLSPQTKVTTTTQSQPGKTLWDLLQLLIVPVVLAIAGFWLNQIQKDREQRAIDERAEREKREVAERAEREKREAEQRDKTEHDIAKDNQQEAALQSYLDKMSELLLKEHLGERTTDRKLKPEYGQVQKIARVRTITILTQLDARRIGYVFTFLREAGLMSTTSNDDAVSLNDADLPKVNWSQADLSKANLSGANLSHARLIRTNLSDANLCEAHLFQANLTRADFTGADLSYANLEDATGKTTEELEKEAKTLKGATMPDGKIYS